MHYLKDDIERLIYQQIAGTISESDNRFLNDVLLDDAAMSGFYESIKARFQSKESQEFVAKIDTEKAWTNISEKIVERKKRTSVYHYLPYAALLILAVSFGFYFFKKAENPVQKLVVKSESVKPGKIQLTLSSGKTLDLMRQINP